MNDQEYNGVSRRDFLTYSAAAGGTAALASKAFGAGGGSGGGVEEATISQLQQVMTTGERTAQSLTEE